MKYEPTDIPKLMSYRRRMQEYSKRRTQALSGVKWPVIAYIVVCSAAVWCMWFLKIPQQNPVSMQAAIATTILIIVAVGFITQGLVTAVAGKKPHPNDIEIDQAMRRLMGMPDAVEDDQHQP